MQVARRLSESTFNHTSILDQITIPHLPCFGYPNVVEEMSICSRKLTSMAIGPTELQSQIRPATTLPDTYQRTAVRLRLQGLREDLHTAKCFDRSPKDSYGRQASQVPLHQLWKVLLRRAYFLSRPFSCEKLTLPRSRRVWPGIDAYTPTISPTFAGTPSAAKRESLSGSDTMTLHRLTSPCAASVGRPP